MDDLLDLDWSGKSPPPKPHKPSYLQGNKKQPDAFGDLLNFDAKPTSPQRPAVTHTPPSTFSNKNNNNLSSFDTLLDPFGKSKKESSSQSLNALKHSKIEQYSSSTSSQWNLDLLDNSQNSTPSADPFDIASLASRTTPVVQSQQSIDMDDDNPLGILSMPAVKTKPESSGSPSPPSSSVLHTSTNDSSPAVGYRDNFDDEFLPSKQKRRGSLDMLIAQMVDMGFEAEQAQVALEATGGRDLQDAVDLLVNNTRAMQQQQRQQQQQPKRSTSNTARARDVLFSDGFTDEEQLPTTERKRPQQQQRRRQEERIQRGESSSPSTSNNDDNNGGPGFQQQKEKIVSQATELGGFLYKNASMFVKTGRERVTKAVEDWQEQQRQERLNREHGRPRWMTEDVADDEVDKITRQNNALAAARASSTNQPQQTGKETYIEKFVDDTDSSDEDPALEKQREMDWKREQEEKKRQYVAQMRKRQQEEERLRQQKETEEVYVSPSRRRATPTTSRASSRASPRVTSSFTKASAPTPPPPQPKPQRQRPIITASPHIMARVNEARQRGNEYFKLGQFGEAESAYGQALGALPPGHDHIVLLSNNRAAARLKIGEYKRCIEDCEIVIEMARESGESIECEGVMIRWREQLIKALHRKGDALESFEKYDDAIKTYQELVKLEGSGNHKINQAMSRCRKALNPIAVSKPSATSSPADDLLGFGGGGPRVASIPVSSSSSRSSKPANVEKSKAVANMRAQAAQQEAEDAERLARTDDVNARIQNWKKGKEQNLRALLATLDTILWSGARWPGAQMSELIDPKRCKITYLKAISKVHPDKLPSSVTVEQRMLASAIFSTLNEAWDSFKAQI
ncbi:hypothetical protein BDC45DRAFT_533316 [Circinella umbellata]|nr:hypothetical protein BDC45DRAFT_533316 [Circinella umbellata]